MSMSSAPTTFIDLPAEIRTIIYPLVLKYEVVLQRPPIGSTDKSLFQDHIALLMSSRQIHKEALPVFYAVNAFEINIYPGFATQPLHPLDLSHTRHLVVIDWCPRISIIGIKKCLRIFKSTLLVVPCLESLEIYFGTRPKHGDIRCAAVPVSLERTRVAKTLLLQYAKILEELPAPMPRAPPQLPSRQNAYPKPDSSRRSSSSP